MKIIKTLGVSLLGASSFMAMMAVTATPASAQASRTWVSGVGDDVNPCSRTAPCKTFAGAISKTAAGGEINCLDPAGFGAVTITKSITIDCTGTLGGVLASSTTGVTVNAAGIIVNLRALEINGGPPNLPGVNGVRFLAGASLTIEDSTIYNFRAAGTSGNGIVVNPVSTTLKLVVIDTTIHTNGTAVSGNGIALLPTGSASIDAHLDHVTVVNNPNNGVRVDSSGTTGQVDLTISNSVVSSNLQGISVSAAALVNAKVMVADSTVANNTGNGIVGNGAGVQVRVAGTVITGNGTGVNPAGGSLVTDLGNNVLSGNAGDGAFN